MVAIGPSIEMKKIVEKYNCGIIAKDFSPKTLAEELNKLTSERIMYYKEQSNKAAKQLNAESNYSKIIKIIDELIKE
jgi:UDP:flavonoid glycosyltransferase YjiC (YdhE family)